MAAAVSSSLASSSHPHFALSPPCTLRFSTIPSSSMRSIPAAFCAFSACFAKACLPCGRALVSLPPRSFTSPAFAWPALQNPKPNGAYSHCFCSNLGVFAAGKDGFLGGGVYSQTIGLPLSSSTWVDFRGFMSFWRLRWTKKKKKKVPEVLGRSRLRAFCDGLWELPKRKDAIAVLALALVGGFNIEGPQSVLEAVGVLAAIVTVHECGHFLAAYSRGIHVSQFSVGFGPAVLKIQGKKVEYSIRVFPLGGFVAFPEESEEGDFAPDDPDLLKNRPILDRFLVASAGVVANVIFAYSILFSQVLTVGLVEQQLYPGVTIPEVRPSSAAATAGIEAGDLILGVDGRLLPSIDSSVLDLVGIIKASPDREISLLVSRHDRPFEIQVKPVKSGDGSGMIGVQLAPNVRALKVRAKDLGDATVKASKEFVELFGIVLDGMRQVVFNFSQTAHKISGPVAIVAAGAEVARSDLVGLFHFAAIVNINLAVVNLLPLPALDGGHLALLAVEALRGGKRLPNKVEQGIMSSGILLLIAVGTFLMVKDALNLGLVQAL
eukprot:c28177_g1_i1 orf=710-2356(+)